MGEGWGEGRKSVTPSTNLLLRRRRGLDGARGEIHGLSSALDGAAAEVLAHGAHVVVKAGGVLIARLADFFDDGVGLVSHGSSNIQVHNCAAITRVEL